jgi:hypothetical protein
MLTVFVANGTTRSGPVDEMMAANHGKTQPGAQGVGAADGRRLAMQNDTWAQLASDSDMRRWLQNASFRALICDERRFKMVDDPEMAAAFRNTALQQALHDPAFKPALRDARFAEAIASSTTCPDWACGASSSAPRMMASAGQR